RPGGFATPYAVHHASVLPLHGAAADAVLAACSGGAAHPWNHNAGTGRQGGLTLLETQFCRLGTPLRRALCSLCPVGPIPASGQWFILSGSTPAFRAESKWGFPVTLTKMAAAACLLCVPALAQWFDYPHKGVPRTPDGKPDLRAPVPKTADGKPDLSGIWQGDQWNPPGRRSPVTPAVRVEPPAMLPWAEKLFAERRANLGKDNPEVRCMPQGIPYASTLPYPFEIVNAPGKTFVLYEMYSLR